MSDSEWGWLSVVGVAAVAIWWFWPRDDDDARAVAISATPGSVITIKGGTFHVNGERVNVPEGTYQSGLRVDANGVTVGGLPLQSGL